MLNVDQVRETLERVGKGDKSQKSADVLTLVAAARAWLASQEQTPDIRPQIGWCTTHQAEGADFCWRAAWADPFPADAKSRCRMVPAAVDYQWPDDAALVGFHPQDEGDER